MAERVRSLITILNNELNKHRMLANASTKFSNVTERAQEKLNSMQSAVAAKYDVITKQVNSDITLIQNLNAAPLEPSPLPKKVVKWWQWYQQLTGLDTVELAKRQVISAQNKLFSCQAERQSLNHEARIINDKLKDVYSELIQTKRDDPKYVQLTIIENKSLQEQARILSQLNLLEKEEKDHFTLLATAIKEYHDSQTMNAQKYKYLSIVASAAVAVISLVGSMIYNNHRNANISRGMAQVQKSNENMLRSTLHSLENNLTEKIAEAILKIEKSKQNVITVNTEADKNVSQDIMRVSVVVGISITAIFIFKALTGY